MHGKSLCWIQPIERMRQLPLSAAVRSCRRHCVRVGGDAYALVNYISGMKHGTYKTSKMSTIMSTFSSRFGAIKANSKAGVTKLDVELSLLNHVTYRDVSGVIQFRLPKVLERFQSKLHLELPIGDIKLSKIQEVGRAATFWDLGAMEMSRNEFHPRLARSCSFASEADIRAPPQKGISRMTRS